MKKKFWILIIIAGIIGVLAYNYIYQDHRNIESETVAYTIKSNDLVNAFLNNQDTAETKYLNQTLLVTGDATEITNIDITLNDAVSCSFNIENNIKSLKTKANISIKGRCIGFDDLLEQVKLDQCVIIQD